MTVLALVLITGIVLSACGGEEFRSAKHGVGATWSAETRSGDISTSMALSPDAVPDIELELLGNANFSKGELVNLYDFAGKPIVLNFWFPSCPPCRREMPDLEKSWQIHGMDSVHFIGIQQISLDSIQDGQEFIDDERITYAVGADRRSRAVVEYKIKGFPTTLFLDAELKEISRWDGPLDFEKLEELVALLLE